MPGEDFNNRIGPVSVRIYHLIYVNIHVKYGSTCNLIRTLLIKILNMKNMVFCHIFWAESRGTKMPTNADLIILETYVQQGKSLITRFSYMSHNVTKFTFLAFFLGGGRGGRIMLCLKFIRNT